MSNLIHRRTYDCAAFAEDDGWMRVPARPAWEDEHLRSLGLNPGRS